MNRCMIMKTMQRKGLTISITLIASIVVILFVALIIIMTTNKSMNTGVLIL